MEKLSLAALVVVGGFLGGAVGGTLFSPSEPGSQPLLADAPQTQADLTQIQDSLNAIQGDQAGFQSSLKLLQGEVKSLQRRPVEAAPVESAEEAPLQARMALESAVPYSAEEEARFTAYMARLEQRKEDEREAEQEARRQRRMDDRVARLAEELNLDQYQRSEMGRVLGDAEQAMTDYWAEVRAGGDFDRGAMRQGMEDLQAKTNEQLGNFLNTDQMTQYQASNQGGFGRFFGGRGGDRPQRDGGAFGGSGPGSGGARNNGGGGARSGG